MLGSYEERLKAATDFIQAVRPGLEVESGALLHPQVCVRFQE